MGLFKRNMTVAEYEENFFESSRNATFMVQGVIMKAQRYDKV